MLRHVHQLFRAKNSRLDKRFVVNALIFDQLRPEQVDPLAVLGARNLTRIAAVATEQFSVNGDVEVNRPFVALQVIPRAGPRLNGIAREPEILSPRCLQVIPDRLPIGPRTRDRKSP